MSVRGEIWDFVKRNFSILIVGILLLLFYFQGCFDKFKPGVPTVTHDTTVIIHEYQSQPYTPATINVLPPKPDIINLPQYQPDTSSIQALRKQFEALVSKHTQQNIYNDTLKVDSLGWVNVKDTISENKLAKRSFNFNIKERLITTTITQPYSPRNQVFIGGGVESLVNKPSFNQVELGLLLKNKKDDIMGLSGTYNIPSTSPGIKFSFYKKLKLKK
jgi:hypothetical protein